VYAEALYAICRIAEVADGRSGFNKKIAKKAMRFVLARGRL